jgi:hypothetical protein
VKYEGSLKSFRTNRTITIVVASTGVPGYPGTMSISDEKVLDQSLRSYTPVHCQVVMLMRRSRSILRSVFMYRGTLVPSQVVRLIRRSS